MVIRSMVQLRDCNTDVMAADTFTKFFTQPAKWNHACLLIGVVPEDAYKKVKFLPHPRPPTETKPSITSVERKNNKQVPKAQPVSKRFGTTRSQATKVIRVAIVRKDQRSINEDLAKAFAKAKLCRVNNDDSDVPIGSNRVYFRVKPLHVSARPVQTRASPAIANSLLGVRETRTRSNPPLQTRSAVAAAAHLTALRAAARGKRQTSTSRGAFLLAFVQRRLEPEK